MKKRCLNSFDARKQWNQDNHFEFNDLPSETVPDMAKSPAQLLALYTSSGRAGVNAKDPVYDAPDLHQMDEMDKLHLAQETQEDIKSLENRMQDEQREELAKQEKAKAEKEQQDKKDTSKDDKRSAKDDEVN